MAQSFAPAPGNPGSTAIHKDSSIIERWATGITLQRGYLDIANPTQGLVSYGAEQDGLYAEGDATTVVSLGDSGVVTLTFSTPIQNGPGNDFAIFENGFADDYLELGHVEVSSNGINFYRFQSTSEIQTDIQINPFSFTDCRMVNNLAGKYRAGYGTPFDLEELAPILNLDVNNITHIKIIDVVGSIDPQYGSFDSHNTIINDGYPSNFASGGFDLDGVAVLYHPVSGIDEEYSFGIVYPNPCENQINFGGQVAEKVIIRNLSGEIVLEEANVTSLIFDFASGVYFVEFNVLGMIHQEKIVVNR